MSDRFYVVIERIEDGQFIVKDSSSSLFKNLMAGNSIQVLLFLKDMLEAKEDSDKEEQ